MLLLTSTIPCRVFFSRSTISAASLFALSSHLLNKTSFIRCTPSLICWIRCSSLSLSYILFHSFSAFSFLLLFSCFSSVSSLPLSCSTLSSCIVFHIMFNPLNPELNPICYLLALLGAHHFLHVSRIRVILLNLRRLMSYIHGAPILDVSRSHTTTQHSR